MPTTILGWVLLIVLIIVVTICLIALINAAGNNGVFA